MFRGGVEERPVYLASALAYPLADLILGGAVVGGSIAIADDQQLSLTGEVIVLTPQLAWSAELSTAWFAQVGWTFGDAI